MKKIDEIKQKCKDTGLEINKVFREAKIPVCTIQNWEKKNPKTFETLDIINETIERMKNEIYEGASEIKGKR